MKWMCLPAEEEIKRETTRLSLVIIQGGGGRSEEIHALKRRRVYYVFVRRSFSFLRNEYSFVTRSTLSQRLDNESLRDDGERKKQKKKKEWKPEFAAAETERERKREGIGKCSRRNNEKEEGGKKAEVVEGGAFVNI